MQLFYCENISSKGIFELDENESYHASKVLRLKQNDTIVITNGKGYFFNAQIIDCSPKKVKVQVLDCNLVQQKRNYYLHIAIAPTKNIDRIEWFVEKAVEIGIDEITPIVSRFSERKTLNLERVEKIAIAAMKQSLKATKPIINQILTFDNFIKKYQAQAKYIADIDTDLNIRDLHKSKNMIFVVGPEGGFSQEEIKNALNYGFQKIKLSEYRLRTETAALFITNAINILF